ncbi:tetratricopeptide repeat protein [Sporolactobacillus shoreicorticis]|uniref:Tetratricopeptide repeat protein n=1 Tax=Sporolactobacillus shoreicorticis TaxID=1923877 RepID=A0ABW5S595_9BACL|nr:tetratricopeptide repeat protein [Sporolactobacillus shoreicorticis]MCO7126436.1 tetratricopeptide repeat protein [Sporolactobacillus shoreicorticis]
MEDCIDSIIQKASSLIEHGQNGRGLNMFQMLSDQHPQESKIWLQYALALDKLAMEEEAIPKYKKALELGLSKEDERIALICLASSYRNVGQIHSALETIEQACEKYRQDVAAHCFYSLILIDDNKPTQAVKTLGGLLLNEVEAQKFDGFFQALSDKFDDL